MEILANTGLAQLTDETRADGDSLVRTVRVQQETQLLRERAHDIAGALAGLKFLAKAIGERYEFSADEAATLAEGARKALALLEIEAEFMIEIYRAGK